LGALRPALSSRPLLPCSTSARLSDRCVVD
jgi:hypothetical protein